VFLEIASGTIGRVTQITKIRNEQACCCEVRYRHVAVRNVIGMLL
jgi:hypothetical protein